MKMSERVSTFGERSLWISPDNALLVIRPKSAFRQLDDAL